jgi:hypothetical protein
MAAYFLLKDLGYKVERWEESPDRLPQTAEGLLLILAEPLEAPSDRQRAAVRRFVERGGRVLLCGFRVTSFFPEASLSPAFGAPEAKELTPAFPSGLSRNAGTILMASHVYWGKVSPPQIRLYGSEEEPAVVAWRIGRGRVLWWSGTTPLTNGGISKKGNLNLFLNSVSSGESGNVRAIYWDEYFHGQRAGLWSYAAKTPLPWGLLQLGILALAAIFTFSRRSGPIAPAIPASRLSPLEFVDTMGGLYRRAGATQVAVDISYRRLRIVLAQRLGLSPMTPDGELAQVAAIRLNVSQDELGGELGKAALAVNSSKISAARALGLVQSLERRVLELTAFGRPSQERH